MRQIGVIIAALALAACASPKETCITSAQKDFRILDALYQETLANVRRGYALERVEKVNTRLVPCLRNGRRGFCQDEFVTTEAIPVAIDLVEEERVLNQLQISRAKAGREADAAIAECQASFS